MAGDIDRTIAPATANGLDDDAVGLVFSGHDRGGGLQRHRGGIPAAAACATDTDTDRTGKPVRQGHIAADIDTAIAAATAGRLDQDTVRIDAGCDDIARLGGRDRAAIAAAAACTTDAHGNADRGRATGGGQGQRTGHVDAAGSATTAIGLGNKARRLVVHRGDLAGGCDHRATIAAITARAANTDRHGATEHGSAADTAANVEAPSAAATAHGLDDNTVRTLAFGVNRTGHRTGDRAAITASATGPANTDRRRDGPGLGDRHGARHIESALAAAAAR